MTVVNLYSVKRSSNHVLNTSMSQRVVQLQSELTGFGYR